MKAIEEHKRRVAAIGCIVTAAPDPTLHHCHSGSLGDIGIHRGISQRPSDWLIIPLVARLHSGGNHGIDGGIGVREWERLYGTQVDHLKKVSRILGYNVFTKAGFPGIDI